MRTLDEVGGQQAGVALLEHEDPAQHLPHDDLDVLVVDRHALAAVHLLDLVHQVLLGLADTEDAQHLLRVGRALGQLLADLDVVALADEQARPLADGVLLDLGAVVRGDQDLLGLVGLLDRDPAGGLGDRRTALGLTRLEQLDHTGQTLRDVVGRGHTTGVEGTHRQLRAGLTDRLGGDDADRLADVDELAGGQRTAVALRAGAGPGVTGEDRADLDLLDARVDELVDLDVAEVLTGGGEHLAGLRVEHLDRRRAGVGRRLGVLRLDHATVRETLTDPLGQTALGAAVVLTDDDVLRDVHQTTGQVTRVGGTQRGVGQTLTSTVTGDEVLEHRQALAEVRLDRARDDLALRVGHQTTHSRDLPDLHPVTASTRVDHHVDRVGLLEGPLQLARRPRWRPGSRSR